MENQVENDNNEDQNSEEEKNNLINIHFDQSTIYYYNASKDNFHFKILKKHY